VADFQVVYNAGVQAIRVVPVDASGKPLLVTSATFGISDLRRSVDAVDREVVAAGTAATLHSFSQTTTAAAGMATADPRVVTMASTTGASVGHKLLLTNLKGDRELVTIDSVTSTTVRATGDILKSYPAGSTLVGVELVCTFPADEANDEDRLDDGGGPYALDLAIVGSNRPAMRFFVEVVRSKSLPLCTLDDLKDLDPVAASVGGDRVDPYTAIRMASNELGVELRMAGIDPSYAAYGEAARVACTYLAAWHALKTVKGADTLLRADAYRERARVMINSLISNRTIVGAVKVSRSTDQAPAPAPVQPGNRGRFARA